MSILQALKDLREDRELMKLGVIGALLLAGKERYEERKKNKEDERYFF